MKRDIIAAILLLTTSLLGAVPARAQFMPQATAIPGSAPQGINYQGRLEDNGFPATGSKQMVFRVFDVLAGGSALWTSPAQTVEVQIGLFNAVVPVPITSLVGGGSRYLEVQIDGTVMAPRELLNSVPYALIAKSVEGTIDVSTAGLSVMSNSGASTPSLHISSQTGNVGVGTSNPGAAFDVDGVTQFGSGANKSTFTATGGLLTGVVVFSSGMATGNSFTVGGSTLAVRAGRVGVGTLTPQTLLDAEGAAQFGSSGKSTFTAAGGLLTGTVVFSSGMATGNSFTVGGSTLAVRAGRVGVGTLTPQTSLDVEGAAQFGSTGKSTVTAAGGILSPQVSVGTGTAGAVPLHVVQTGAGAGLAHFENTGSGHVVRLGASGSFQHVFNGIDSRYVLGPNANNDTGVTGHDYGGLSIGSSGLYSAITSGGSALNGGIRELYFFTNNDFSAAKMKIASGGNVGIGTSGPASKLHLSSGTIVVDGNAATSLTAIGSVGVGTDSPVQRLEVRAPTGSPATSGSTQNGIFRIQGAAGGNGLDFGVLTSAPFGTWLQSGFKISDLSINYPILLNPNGGNIGVGTLNPASKLHMSSGTVVVDGNVATSLTTTGSVGVGTASPQSTMQVVGNYMQIPSVSGANPAAGDCDAAAEAGRLVVRSDGGAGQRLWVCLGAAGWQSF